MFSLMVPLLDMQILTILSNKCPQKNRNKSDKCKQNHPKPHHETAFQCQHICKSHTKTQSSEHVILMATSLMRQMYSQIVHQNRPHFKPHIQITLKKKKRQTKKKKQTHIYTTRRVKRKLTFSKALHLLSKSGLLTERESMLPTHNLKFVTSALQICHKYSRLPGSFVFWHSSLGCIYVSS